MLLLSSAACAMCVYAVAFGFTESCQYFNLKCDLFIARLCFLSGFLRERESSALKSN